MTRPPLRNVGASVRARLTDYARQRDENAQLVMTRFAIERLIYPLSQSGYRDHFILKGAMLFSLWAPVPYRSTGDLDLLGQGDPAPDRMAAIFKALCELTVPDNGVVYDPDSVRAESARDDEDYQGVRIALTASMANARLPIQIDIGFGDAVTPAATEVTYPSLLDFPPAVVKAYPPETVVAEKLEALGGGVGDKNIAVMDAACGERLAFHPHRIASGPAQIEEGGEIHHPFNVVLRRGLKPRRLVTLVLRHEPPSVKNITRTHWTRKAPNAFKFVDFSDVPDFAGNLGELCVDYVVCVPRGLPVCPAASSLHSICSGGRLRFSARHCRRR
jgi:hypothetical protein